MPSARSPAENQRHSPARRRGDFYYGRLFATAFCFGVFGVSALALGTVVFPLLRLWPGSPAQHQRRARATVQRALRAFSWLMLSTRAMTFSFVGLERLGRPGQLVIANHPTLIDAIFLIGFMPNLTNCVMKSALLTNPLTRAAARAAGYVPNAPTDAMIEGAGDALRAGESVVMFPEGTRTRPGETPIFHRGAANIALRSARHLTPVFIRCTPPMLTKSMPWYRVPARRVHMEIRVGADVELGPYQSLALPKGSRSLNQALQDLFEREVPIY